MMKPQKFAFNGVDEEHSNADSDGKGTRSWLEGEH